MDESFYANVTVKNVSDSCWTNAGHFRLGILAINDTGYVDTGIRAEIATNQLIRKGETCTFVFDSITLPHTVKSANAIRLIMCQEGNQYFGEYVDIKMVP